MGGLWVSWPHPLAPDVGLDERPQSSYSEWRMRRLSFGLGDPTLTSERSAVPGSQPEPRHASDRAEARPAASGRPATLWERFSLSIVFWPVVTLCLIVVWFAIIAIAGGLGYWVGFGLFATGLAALVAAKKRARKRVGGVYWHTSNRD